MSDALSTAMRVLDDYMAALNRGDEPGVNAACNFPHVRLAGGKVTVWQNPGDFKLTDFVARAGDGWARSQWDERTPIHVTTDKVHLKVVFSRWTADGTLIGRFDTIYIVTRQNERWGIQARSSFAS